MSRDRAESLGGSGALIRDDSNLRLREPRAMPAVRVRGMARFFVPLVLLLALAVPHATRAHTQSTSFIAIEMRGDEPVALRWDLSVHDLIWSVFIDADFDGLASQEEIEAARAAIEKAVLAQITI